VALADEVEEGGPEVALVGGAELGAGRAEGLAGAASCPNRFSCWPVGELEGEGPASDAGKEMALRVLDEVIGFYFEDAAGVDVSSGDVSLFDKLAQPGCCFRVVFIVIVHSWFGWLVGVVPSMWGGCWISAAQSSDQLDRDHHVFGFSVQGLPLRRDDVARSGRVRMYCSAVAQKITMPFWDEVVLVEESAADAFKAANIASCIWCLSRLFFRNPFERSSFRLGSLPGTISRNG
jgi:hypothetical protein